MNPTEKLVAYCMGALSSEDRLEVEENLLTSKEFLTQFISVKRAIESNESFEVQPSSTLKSRLKLEVERSFGTRQTHAPTSSLNWLSGFTLKPAMGVAFAVLILLGSAVLFLNKPAPVVTHHLEDGISVDAVNPSPINFNFL